MLALVVANTNPRLPEKMQDLFGGSISVRAGRNNGKEQHVWSVSAMKAFVALKRLQPFIVGKVEEVAVVMRFAATVSGSKPRVTSPAVLVLREECRMELMRLHRRWRPTARRKQVVGQA
jgi:TPP-dependent indolepyruvate ferredoxin oxidoreductase alpha subunit